MSYWDIPGTPLQINIGFANPPHKVPSDHAVVGDGQLTPLGKLLGALISPDVVTALQQLVTPLDQIFGNLWTDPSTQSSIQTAVQQALQATKPNAYNITTTVPQQGSLRADFHNFSPGVAAALPPGTQGLQLTLSYQVPGFQVSFSETTDSIWGSWADPSYNVAFDGEVEIAVGVPADPRIPPAALAQFIARNPTGSPSNAFAGWSAFWQGVGDVLSGRPLPNGNLPDQFVGIGAYLASLYQILAQIGPPLAQVYALGFRTISPIVTTALPGAPTGNTAQINLTHPADPPPQVSLAGSTPSIFSAQIGASPGQVHAGDQVKVIGNYFPPAQSSQLTIAWTDTTSGQVVKTAIAWGPAATTTAGAPAPPSNPHQVTIVRHGPYDNLNARTFKGLLPGTTYAFQVQDFDVPGYDVIATQLSDWTYFTTSATDAVELVLDYQSALLGFATLQPDGSFVATVIVPASVPAGAYVVQARLAGQVLAQTRLTVVDASTALPPSLQILDPATGMPFTAAAIVVGTSTLRVRGAGYSAGQVDLFVDAPSGKNLGTAVADASGTFTTDVTWPFGVTGPHAVAGQQGGAQATAPVFAENPAT